MKKSRFILTLTFSALFGFSALAQEEERPDSTGTPGDQFSLQGALAMFQKAGSPEEFEKLINSSDNNVNNLDLNGDGEVDYIRVVDKSEKDMHALILQVPVSETESQDIAVIEIEKTGDTSAVLQIVGDEEIFGEDLIVEPNGGDELEEDGQGPYAQAGLYTPARVVVNVWFWPSVRFIYGPVYRPWVSPWRWHYYPAWYRPWRPFTWAVWHPRRAFHHRHFVVVRTHRVVRCHAFYRPVRMSSVTVRTRHATAVNHYRVTRTRTTVTGPRGNKAVRTTTTVKGRNGQVKAKRTTVRKKRG